jgi:ABC-type dipeptide/oligopeptide/nickel transport system permease component
MNRKLIKTLQILSISLIWVLFSGIAVWIFTLIRESRKLHDAPDASVGISIVAIPVFFLLASVLTYVFIGLQRGRTEDTERQDGQEAGP